MGRNDDGTEQANWDREDRLEKAWEQEPRTRTRARMRSVHRLTSQLYERLSSTFDTVLALGMYIDIFEHQIPGAEIALRCWAETKQIALAEHSHVVESDFEIPEFRGRVVSTLSCVQFGRITLHRRTVP